MARGSSKYLEESITARVARFSTRHRWYIIGAWLALVAVAATLAFDIGDVLTTDDSVATNAESERATTLLEERLRGPEAPQEFVVLRASAGTADDGVFENLTGELLGSILRAGGHGCRRHQLLRNRGTRDSSPPTAARR